jgi:hypothetical protein
MVVGEFNTPLLPIDKSSRQKKNNTEILELNNTINQMDLTDVYKPSLNGTIYILLTNNWILLQYRLYIRAKRKPQKYKKI